MIAAVACSSDATTAAGAPTPLADAGPTATATRPAPASPAPAPSPTPEPGPDPAPAARTDHPSAAALGADLVAAEVALRDRATPPDHLAGWAHVQQAAYRQLALTAAWQPEVRAMLPAPLTEAFEHNLAATIELFELTDPRTELPPWVIVPAPPAEELLAHYRAAGSEFGLDWTYLAAIHLVESRMGRIRGDSHAGARGPMQFLPATWDAYGEGDIEDPADAILAAARYLAAHGAPGDMDRALWAYNHSNRYVRAVQHYAAVMREDVAAYRGYYDWQVYYRLVTGDELLPEGWDNRGA